MSASLVAFCGLALLRYSWGKRGRQSFLNLIAWLFIILALVLWGSNGGGDRGVAVGLCIFVCFALLFILREVFTANTNRNEKRRENEPKRHTTEKVRFVSAEGVMTFVMNGPILGGLAFLLAMSVHELMLMTGAHVSNSLVLALFLFPILWACLVAYFLIGMNRVVKSMTLIGLSIISVAALVMGN